MRKPVMGTMLMLSTPPATITSAPPARIRSQPMAIVCSPEEQKRLTVMPGTLDGKPAIRLTLRAMFSPWGPSGKAQPRMTSSASAGSKSPARLQASRTTALAMSSGR